MSAISDSLHMALYTFASVLKSAVISSNSKYQAKIMKPIIPMNWVIRALLGCMASECRGSMGLFLELLPAEAG